jgi:rare lipoprotein A
VTRRFALPLLALIAVAACATQAPAAVRTPKARGPQVGLASYYSDALAGRPTASGEPYDPTAASCAHRRHRFGTRLRVTVLATGKSVECVVNDRGPFVKGRIVDLSRSLAEELGIMKQGVARVRVERVRSR